MIELLIWSIAAFAFSWGIAESKLSLPFRVALEVLRRKKIPGPGFLLMLLECSPCNSFHIGWIAYVVGIAPFQTWWQAAFFTCGTSLLLAKYVGLLDE